MVGTSQRQLNCIHGGVLHLCIRAIGFYQQIHVMHPIWWLQVDAPPKGCISVSSLGEQSRLYNSTALYSSVSRYFRLSFMGGYKTD